MIKRRDCLLTEFGWRIECGTSIMWHPPRCATSISNCLSRKSYLPDFGCRRPHIEEVNS